MAAPSSIAAQQPPQAQAGFSGRREDRLEDPEPGAPCIPRAAPLEERQPARAPALARDLVVAQERRALCRPPEKRRAPSAVAQTRVAAASNIQKQKKAR